MNKPALKRLPIPNHLLTQIKNPGLDDFHPDPGFVAK
jgi:hypothetical protein